MTIYYDRQTYSQNVLLKVNVLNNDYMDAYLPSQITWTLTLSPCMSVYVRYRFQIASDVPIIMIWP